MNLILYANDKTDVGETVQRVIESLVPQNGLEIYRTLEGLSDKLRQPRKDLFITILEAEDGQLALEELKKNKVDLIISDWNMPNMTELEFLKAVRSDESFKKIPFVMVTAEGKKDNVMEAAKAGVSNYVVKPFTPETLEEKLKKVID